MSIATVKDLKIHLDPRGYLYETLRADDPFFQQFGQAYLSAINPNTVKGFHKHFQQTDHVVCVAGQVKMVLVKGEDENAVVEEYHLSLLNPKMIVIPPDTWHGWQCIGNETALVLNFSTHPFNPDNPDEVRIEPHKNPFGYSWQNKDK